MPGGVDTPAYRLAANYSEPTAGPKGFLASPEKIARVVVRCAARPRPEVVVGNSIRTLRFTHALLPRLVERSVARTIEKGFLREESEDPNPGNLFAPAREWSSTDGGFNAEAKRRAARKARRVIAGGTSVLGPGILAWLALRAGRTRGRR